MADLSYQQIEIELCEEATKCLSMSRTVTGAVDKRQWLEAANHALIGAEVAKRTHLVGTANNPA
jgi:hypothetical protein